MWLVLWMWRASKIILQDHKPSLLNFESTNHKRLQPLNHIRSVKQCQVIFPHALIVLWSSPVFRRHVAIFEVDDWGMALCCSLVWCPWLLALMVWCEQFWLWAWHTFWWALVIFFALLLSLDLELMVPVVEAAQHLKVKNSQSSLGVQDHDLWLPKPFLMLTNEQLKPGILGTKLLEIFTVSSSSTMVVRSSITCSWPMPFIGQSCSHCGGSLRGAVGMAMMVGKRSKVEWTPH